MKPQWARQGPNDWSPVGAVEATLPPGSYYPVEGGMFSPPFLHAFAPLSDKAILVDDGVSQSIFAGITKFWEAAAMFTAFGLLHKRGILMEGPPGAGKSVTCQLLAQEIIKRNGYALFVNSHTDIELVEWALRSIRTVHDTPILTIFEDIDGFAEDSHELRRLLNILDGNNQIGNVVHIATTNYIERLDTRITNRPSRFDEVIHVGPPSAKARESYMRQLIPAPYLEKAPISALTKASEGLMLAHLREFVVSTLVLNHPIEAVAARLQAMNAVTPTATTTTAKTAAKTVAAAIFGR